MRIRIWGARGSTPAPLKPDEVQQKIYGAILGMPNIDTNDPEAVKAYVEELPPLLRGTAGGNTACVEIQAGGETFIIDAGSGIRELGLELMKGPCGRGQGKVHIFFSHPHWDHIQGFPLFLPAFVPGNQLIFYSVHDIESALIDQQRYLFFPVSIDSRQAEREFRHLEESQRRRYRYIPFMKARRVFRKLEAGVPFSVGPFKINTIRNNHPGDAFSYRFEDQHSVFVYASDAEYQDLDDASIQARLDFFKGADALIFDAQYGLRESWESKVDFGHSSAMIGVDLARLAGVKKLVLFHHEPAYSDLQLQEIQSTAIAYQAQDNSLPTCEVLMAYEGLALDLTPVGAIDWQLSPGGEAAILTPSTTFDELGVDHLADHLAHVANQEGPAGSVIDLSHVERLTIASLKRLVSFSHQREAGPVALAAPSREVRQVIKLGGYNDYFAIYETVEAAVAAVQVREALNLPGQVINNQYQITAKLGQGRLGTVLQVTDLEEKREAALKILSSTLGVETVDRFARHAHSLLELKQRNIVPVFDCDWSQQDDLTFIVEALMSGPTLQKRLEDSREPLPPDEALDIALDLTRALEYAHKRGVLHGNLKPQDVFLTEEGAKLNGFGLAYMEEGRNLLDPPLLFLAASYLAPEQILGYPLGARTDLYALGVILYQLFTGRPPFEGTEQEVMRAHLDQPPTPPRKLNADLSRSAEHLILKLLAKNPGDRYAGAQQVRRICSSLIFSTVESGRPFKQNLVGREQQLPTLFACWDQAKAGRGQIAFISGESGIGKTSLARQIAARSAAPVVLLGHCRQQNGSPLYHPFSEALETYLAGVPPEFFDQETRSLMGNFVRLLPELRQFIPDLPESPPLEVEREQLRLITGLTQFIKQVTQARPWLLILDDLQWADQCSIELLRYLGHHLPEMSLFIIGTYCQLEVDSGHPLEGALPDLRQLPTCHHLALERLSRAEVAQVLGNIWDSQVPEPLTARIYRQTAGNPLYIEEVAKSMVDDGLVMVQAGQWQYPEVESVRLPQSARGAVRNRVQYLSAEARDILSQVAVFGQTFRFDDAVAMSGLSEWEVLDHLALALERQLVQEVSGGDTLRFSHAEIHHVIYHDLGVLRRRRLHRRAGETLERRAQPEPERLAQELAHHFSEAGESEKALVYSLQAAAQAKDAYANETALQWYNRTLTLLGQLRPEEAAPFQLMKTSIHQSMAEVLTLLGRYDEALNYHGD